MKQIGLWFLVLIIIGGITFYVQKNGVPTRLTPKVEPTSTPQNSTRLSIENKITIPVELADTPEKRVQGLSDRESLPENEGMLFIFDQPGNLSFWMKDMHFPLDMIWIGEDNTIVDITENVPHPDPNTPLSQLPSYSSKAPAKMVLEVNAGFVVSNNIEVGNSVKLN